MRSRLPGTNRNERDVPFQKRCLPMNGRDTTKDLNVITDVWRRKLNKPWTLAKFSEDGSNKPTPHRFRHKFARILLQRGVRLKDVADHLGNSEATCRKHYAAWIP